MFGSKPRWTAAARGRGGSRSGARATRACVTSLVCLTLIWLSLCASPAPARGQSSSAPDEPRMISPYQPPATVETTVEEAREQLEINEECSSLARRFVYLTEEYKASRRETRAAVAEAKENATSRDEWKAIAGNRATLVTEAREGQKMANKRARVNLVKGGVWGFLAGVVAAAFLF
jgi:hypothetical protein